MVLPDRFIDQDSPVAMYAQAGLDANAIVAKAFETLGRGGDAARLHAAGAEGVLP
jgi:1-deoxy-D-xylulose-5-phosphate synthase